MPKYAFVVNYSVFGPCYSVAALVGQPYSPQPSGRGFFVS